MKTWFSTLTAKFDALALRERRLIAVALLGGLIMIAWALFIDPAITQTRRAERAITDQRTQLSTLQSQVALLQSPNQGPEAQAKAELVLLKKQLNEMGQRLSTMEVALVPPQRMSSLLENMIGARNGLRLISLRTLPVKPVREKKETAGAVATNSLESKTPDKTDAGLFKHGVEIKLEGSYAELADYLARLEKSPQKLLWSSVSLSAEKHPKLVLTLTVFTLSLDRTWLIV